MHRASSIHDIGASPRIEKAVSWLYSCLDTHARIYLIGSRARGDNTEKSDWDIAIDTGNPLAWNTFACMRQQARDIAFPDEVDIIDWQRAPALFRESVADAMVEVSGS
jgi:predicted nucleotidyltransferase